MPLDYTLVIDELECLYIYKIKSQKSQYFTCQVCFPSLRAHRKEIEQMNILLELERKKEYENNELFFYSFCGIKIIKKGNFSNVEKPYFYDIYDNFSFKEIKIKLQVGEYIIMVYIESSFNKGVLRLLSEEEIKIQLINKIPKGKIFLIQ